MGSIFSKKVEPKDELEMIVGQLKQIDEKITGLRTQRKSLSKFFMVSVFVCIVSIAIDYIYKKPQSSTSIIIGFCVVSYCVLYLVCHIIVARLYSYRTGKQYNAKELLVKRKMKLMEEIKEKVNFNIARELILKYGNEEDLQELNTIAKPKSPPKTAPLTEMTPNVPKKESNLENSTITVLPKTPANFGKPIPFSNDTPKPRPMPFETPKPIRPFVGGSRTPMDKLVDFVIGDGPNNRYALICKNCETHNGMALPEEFDRLSYYCYKCNYRNQAKSKKISPPPRGVSADVVKRNKPLRSPSAEPLNQENMAPKSEEKEISNVQ